LRACKAAQDGEFFAVIAKAIFRAAHTTAAACAANMVTGRRISLQRQLIAAASSGITLFSWPELVSVSDGGKFATAFTLLADDWLHVS
jgi:hypothetical protein